MELVTPSSGDELRGDHHGRVRLRPGERVVHIRLRGRDGEPVASTELRLRGIPHRRARALTGTCVRDGRDRCHWFPVWHEPGIELLWDGDGALEVELRSAASLVLSMAALLGVLLGMFAAFRAGRPRRIRGIVAWVAQGYREGAPVLLPVAESTRVADLHPSLRDASAWIDARGVLRAPGELEVFGETHERASALELLSGPVWIRDGSLHYVLLDRAQARAFTEGRLRVPLDAPELRAPASPLWVLLLLSLTQLATLLLLAAIVFLAQLPILGSQMVVVSALALAGASVGAFVRSRRQAAFRIAMK